MKINNTPDYADKYEFIVARDCGEAGLWFWGAYADGYKAQAAVHEIDNGVIIHNVRISGKI